MQEQPRNRDWVKNAAIIFLVVLLVLTFFSNTIMNRSLPEVATQEVTGGSIVARVRGTGTVQANSNTQVKMDRTRVIRSVLVKVGQKVEAGDVLFTLGEGASEEIDAAEEKLQSLQASYNRTAATIPDFSYSADQLRIKSYEEALNDAQRKYDSVRAKMNNLEKTTWDSQDHRNQKVAEAAARLKAAQLLKDTAEELYNQQIAEREQALEEAKRRNEEQVEDWESQVSETQTLLDNIASAKAEKDLLVGSTIPGIELQISEVQRLLDNITTQEDPYLTQLEDLNNQLSVLQAKLAEIESQEVSDQSQIEALTQQINNISVQITQLQDQLNNLDPNSTERSALELQIEALKQEQDRLSYNLQAIGMNDYNKELINSQYTSITEQISNIESQASTVSQNKEELISQLSLLEQEKADKLNRVTSIDEYLANYTEDQISKLNNDLSTLLAAGATPAEIEELMHELANVSEADLDSATAYLDKCEAEYEAAWAELDTELNSELQYAKETLRAAQLNYDTAKASLREKISSNETTLAGYNVDLANLWQQIQRAQEKLDELLGGEEATVVAKVAGTIQTLDASPGDTKKKDDVIATIEAPDMGYTLSFSVTNDQANRLRVGDTGTVSNFYWGSEITATLNSIKIDQKNPQTNKVLTFDVNGNVTSGTELTVSVGQKSANYDVIVPSSSVRTDANGTFVLKLESKNSPLGNRYYAKRVPVEVLAVDDSNSALNADLGFGDYVITSSSTPLKSGQLVRLATGS